MSRRYSGRKGKSGSKKPLVAKVPSWVRYQPKEVELLIVKLAKEGKAPSSIGLILRDTYGIPSVQVLAKKSITEILKEKHLLSAVPEDLMALIKTNIKIRKHMETNRQDMVAKRGLQFAESQIHRLIKYYKSTDRLAQEWTYDPEKIRLLIE